MSVEKAEYYQKYILYMQPAWYLSWGIISSDLEEKEDKCTSALYCLP